MSNLILLEDEPILRDELAEFLIDQGHCVDAVCNLGEFNQCFDPEHHSIALVDLSLPDGDGLALVAQLRARSLSLGIIILTARVGTSNKVLGLGTGADHYLPKSTDLDELAAVVLALAHRLERGGVNPLWILDSSTKRLIPPGRLGLELSAQDFLVLRAIITSQRLTTSKKDIVRALGANFLDYDTRRIDTQINRLRRKTLELSGCELPLKTLRNAGYQFCAPAALR